jgi:hypothetical protein
VQEYDSQKMMKFDEIVQFVKGRIFDHRCEAYQKFKTCRHCGEKGKNTSCDMTFVNSGKIPRITLDLMTCSTLGSITTERIELNGCNGRMEDLIDVVVAAGVQRLTFHRISLKDTFSGPMVAILLKSSTTFLELELIITKKKNGGMEDFSIAAPLIAKGLQSNRSLQLLRILAPTNVQDADIATLVESVTGHPSLEKLDFGSHCIWCRTPCRDKTLQAICSVLESNCQVRSVKLSNFFPSFGARRVPHHVSFLKDSVIAALSGNQTLERLEIHVSRKQEGPEILAAFLIGCASARKLKYLDISGNRLDEDTMAALVDLVGTHTTLEEVRAKNLDLVGTDLGALIASLEENATLKLLDISTNQLDSTPLFTRLVSALTVNQTLEALILERCDISDDCCTILAEKLPYMKGLKYLNLNMNPFYNSGARRLLDGLKANGNLHSLQVGKSSCKACHCCGPLDKDYDKSYKNEHHQVQSLVHVNRFLSSVRASRMPPNLWPLVLETADNDLDLTYFMLREEILLQN